MKDYTKIKNEMSELMELGDRLGLAIKYCKESKDTSKLDFFKLNYEKWYSK